MSLIASDHFRIVVGLGKSGMSLVRYLARRGLPFAVVDTRENPPELATLRAQYPQVEVRCGELDAEFLCSARELYVSPGLSLRTPALVQAAAKGVRISGDIDLFAREAKAPIVAITGSNAKSTVTTLVGEMAVAADKRVAVGGNLGTPALDLLADDIELYVLELSSFQLETCDRLNAEVATVLNVSEDHMDRYDGMADYHLAKHRIFRGARQVVVNRADALTRPLIADTVPCWSFDLNKPDFKAFGLIEEDGQKWLAFQFDKLLPVGELKIRGAHNYSNALRRAGAGPCGRPAVRRHARRAEGVFRPGSSLPVGTRAAGRELLRRFQGHQRRRRPGGDRGLGADIDGKLVLLAGGDGKGADFHDLREPVARFCRAVVLLGRDAGLIAQALGNAVPLVRVATLDEAVRQAAELAREGDAVLLSPACASLDMFKNFEERGRLFAKAVEELA